MNLKKSLKENNSMKKSLIFKFEDSDGEDQKVLCINLKRYGK